MTQAHHIHEANAKREDETPPMKRKHQELFDTFPAEWRKLIEHCESKQLSLKLTRALDRDWSDAEFARGCKLPGSSWHMLKSGAYPLPKSASAIKATLTKLRSLEQRCADIDAEIADAARRASVLDVTGRFVETTDYLAIKEAITSATAQIKERSEERLIVFVAPTRCGKTWTKRKLIEEGAVQWEMSGMPSWHFSYAAVLTEFAAIFAVPHKLRDSSRVIEAAVLKKARTISGVIWIEEVQGLCKPGQEFIKKLLNETTLTIIISLTPDAHAMLKDAGGDEESQLLARCEITLKAEPITPEWVKLYAPELWAKEHKDEHLKKICDAANERGARSLVRKVCATLTEQTRGKTMIRDEHVADALKLYRMAVPLKQSTRRAGSVPAGRRAA